MTVPKMSVDITSPGCRFDVLVERAKQLPAITVAVCYPLTRVALEGAVEATTCGLIRPILVGPKSKIESLAAAEALNLDKYESVDAPDEIEAARISVELCRDGHANALMKGSLHTDVFMRPVLVRETGLRTTRRISHIFVMETPAYSRILLITDAAINISNPGRQSGPGAERNRSSPYSRSA